MNRQLLLRNTNMRGGSRSVGRAPAGVRDLACLCSSNRMKNAAAVHGPSRGLLHLDECGDPDCLDLEQLKDLQKSLDHFTDYEHYERCCDGRHTKEECCHTADCKGDEACEDPCADCFEDCDECADEHADCYDEVEVRYEDCEECEEECEERGHHLESCPGDHPTSRDNCVAACDDCVDTIPLPLLGPTNDFDLFGTSHLMQGVMSCQEDCGPSILIQQHGLRPPPPLPPSEPTFDTALDHWHTFVQAHHCAPDPCLSNQQFTYNPPQHVQSDYGFTFGCDPTIPGNQYHWQSAIPHCAVPVQHQNDTHAFQQMSMNILASPTPTQLFQPAEVFAAQAPPMPTTVPTPYMIPTTEQQSTSTPTPTSTSTSTPTPTLTPTSTSTSTPATTTDRTCQWLMPCGSICGTTYTRTEDLKKHVKNSHATKGILTCRWSQCISTFATEPALTGHISKKHLLSLSTAEDSPWKCTFPSCNKSFMYKQVRDEHEQSHTGSNKMHCPVCHQWLNSEGSNFRRHMASHGPKADHMRCKFEALGCRRRFPRLDNLRRHEDCCKFGKRAAGVHHHHRHVHVGHHGN